jgi:hypothetical protein
MRYFALILALGLGLTSAAHAAKEVPTANQCVRATYNQYGRTVHNDCSEAIEVVLHFSDGNSDLEMMNPNSQTSGEDGHTAVWWFACPQPAYPNAGNSVVQTTNYNTGI